MTPIITAPSMPQTHWEEDQWLEQPQGVLLSLNYNVLEYRVWQWWFASHMSVMCLYFAVMKVMLMIGHFCFITCPAGMSAIIHTLLQSYTNKFLHCNHLANIINLWISHFYLISLCIWSFFYMTKQDTILGIFLTGIFFCACHRLGHILELSV